ncbi:uncharacterized protein [Henckelia pumila]|uniref:uncharacterized protein n=1 Tax=Henckelia pumila TaxID=405737 RepID=UPI003C6E72E3
MTVGNGQNVKVCGICTALGHETDMCPTLQEETSAQVNAAGGFPGTPQQRNYDPYSNTFNPGWKDHPNLRYYNPLMNQPAPQAPPQNQAYKPPYHPRQQRPQIPAPGNESKYPTLENSSGGQLATTINRLETQNSSRLPSQTMMNPKENVSAITLKSGRELKVHEEVVKKPIENEEVEESKLEETELNNKEAPRAMFPPLSEYKPIAPFPLALKESRKDESIKGLYEIFRRCEVNISLLDAIKQVSAVIQRKILTKCKDPGMFSIPFKIGYIQLDTTMLDLGASINVMSYSVYASLKLGPLNETTIVVQMADKSTIFPRGVVEDVLVQVDKLVFPADFYVIDMNNNDLNCPILLGKPFLKTSKSIIDVNNSTLTMKFYGEIVKFHIFDTLKIPGCEIVVNNLDVNEYLSKEHKIVVKKSELKEEMAQPAKNSIAEIFISDLQDYKLDSITIAVSKIGIAVYLGFSKINIAKVGIRVSYYVDPSRMELEENIQFSTLGNSPG